VDQRVLDGGQNVAYFPDLSPYSYGYHPHPGVVHVGWLDGVHPFPTGNVEPRLIERMKVLASRPVEIYRGRHLCEFCKPPEDLILPDRKMINPAWAKWVEQRSSNGEIRVAGEQVVYAAPILITHYIEVHEYLPPAEFLEAVAKTE